MKTLGFLNSRVKKLVAVILVVGSVGVVGIWVSLNSTKVDSFIGNVYESFVGPHHYTACYQNFLLSATSDEFFKFMSGYGRNSLADVRLQFPDGNIYALKRVPPEAVEKIYPRKTVSSQPSSQVPKIRFNSGFTTFVFNGSSLEGLSLTETSGIKIDFGDGKFLELPIAREPLLKVLGDPIEWQASRTSLP